MLRPDSSCSAATPSAWIRSHARSLFSRPSKPCSRFRPGIVCPMTAYRRTPRSRRGAWRRCASLAHGQGSVVLATINAALQRVPPREFVAGASFSLAAGNAPGMDAVVRYLELNGFARSSTVRDTGEYAVRGGIVDLFAPGHRRAGAARFLRRHAGIDPHLRSGDPAHHRLACAPRSGADQRSAARRGFRAPLPSRLSGRVRRPDQGRRAVRIREPGPPPSRHGALAAAVLRASRHLVRLLARQPGRARTAAGGSRPRRGSIRSPTTTPRARKPSRRTSSRSTSRCRRSSSICRTRTGRRASAAPDWRGCRRSRFPPHPT